MGSEDLGKSATETEDIIMRGVTVKREDKVRRGLPAPPTADELSGGGRTGRFDMLLDGAHQ